MKRNFTKKITYLGDYVDIDIYDFCYGAYDFYWWGACEILSYEYVHNKSIIIVVIIFVFY